MSNDEHITNEEYREKINMFADEIEYELQEYPAEEVHELTWEAIDSSNWIIYYDYHTDVIDATDSDPVEWRNYVRDFSSWKDVLQAMAFCVMLNDLETELYERGVN